MFDMNKFFTKFFLLLFIIIFLSETVCFAQFSQNKNVIIDDFAEIYLKDKYSDVYFVKTDITDELTDVVFCLRYGSEKYQKKFLKQEIKDDFAERYLKKHKKEIYVRKKYDFSNMNNVVVKISPVKYFSTKMNVNEGTNIYFRVVEDVKKNNQVIIPKNAIITGRVELISQNNAKGIPADLIVGNFKYKATPLSGNIEKTGSKRYYWVMPAAFVLNTLFFATGYPLWAVRGGHAKLKPKQVYEIYLLNDLQN